MKKKWSIFLLGVIFIILMVGTILYILKQDETLLASNNNDGNNQPTNEIITEEIKELQIYDIEEGYLTVPYNNRATKHKYDLSKLSKNDNNYYTYIDNSYETKLGIDISIYQGKIDWKEVKDSGIEFAIIRLGFRGYGQAGKLVLDNKFEENVKQASNQEIKVGVYFFSQAINEEEAIEEANYVLEKIKDKKIEYPVCFDLEKIKYDEARTDHLTSEEITKITLAFCQKIEEAGYIPIIYGNSKTFTTRMQLEQLNNYQKWYADYQETPIYPYEFSIWQYTEKGRVNGIDGYVDLNLHFISK